MGNRKAIRAKFFAQHPFCCYCGGGVPATEEDHIPARSLFFRRAWPEGYVFPSCESCNRGAADDELIMGVLVRLRMRASTGEERRERRKAIEGVKARFPDFFSRFRKPSRMEVRRHARETGVFDRYGVDPGNVTMLRLPLEAQNVANRYGERLARALHYLHTGKILPVTGEAWARAYSNADIPEQEIPAELFTPLSSGAAARVVRSGQELHEQFSYKYVIVEDGEASCFLIRFGESMTILAIAQVNAAIDPEARKNFDQALAQRSDPSAS